MELEHPVWDADNHYYEALDAFTRHLDPALGPRTVQWATIDGRQYHVLGGKVSRAVTNATFDPISKPGCLSEYFRGNPNQVNPLELLRDHEPIRPEYRDPAARLQVLDEQGLAGLLPVPDARDDLRGAAEGRPRGGVHHLPSVQPLARRGLDVRLRGPHPHRALPHPRRRGVGGGGARVGARPGRPDDRDASGGAHHRHRPPQPLRPDVRPVLGAGERGGHHRRRPRRRQRPVVERLRRRRLRGQLPLGRLRSHASRASTSRRRSTTTSSR